MIRGVIGRAMRLVRSAVIVAVLVGLASSAFTVPIDVALGYALVGWGAWALLRRPVKLGRHLAGKATRPLGRAVRR